MESSRRDLLNNVAEHKSILKINQNTYYPRFSFTPKTRIKFPKTGVLFLLIVSPLRLTLKTHKRRQIQKTALFSGSLELKVEKDRKSIYA